MKEPTVDVRPRRTRIPLVALSAAAVVAVALVGGLLTQRLSGVAEPEATPPLTSAPPLTQPSGPEGTQPPLTGLELKVINALGTLGITGLRAQLPFRDASIWADLGSGSQLFVNAYPLGTVDRNFTVIDDRQVAGIRVQHVWRPSSADGVTSSRFECTSDEYWVRGAVPPGFVDIDALVERFIGALGCRP